MIPEGIDRLPIGSWTNKHENFTHKLEDNASFSLWNPPGASARERYAATTKNFQWLINHAINNTLKLRAMGKGWSFSKVGVTKGGLVDTASLNFSFQPKQKQVSQQYTKTPDDLYFVQCGVAIYELNNRLSQKRPQRSIKASGASNGQTIAGALSTGTHGAGIRVGAIQDAVVGLHIITSEDKHIWLERKSYPVASQDMVDWLGAELISNDAQFNAALVSFGSFGFIHGVMIETEPQFLLEEHRVGNIAYSEPLKKAMQSLDVTDLNIAATDGSTNLYHFEVLFNLHKFAPNNTEKGAFLKYMFKRPYHDGHQFLKRPNEFSFGEDLLGIISKLLDDLSPVSDLAVPPLVNSMYKRAFAPQDVVTGTIKEIFNYTKFLGKVASAAMGIDIEDSPKVVELIMEVNKHTPFPGGLSLRYVKGTKATLGFTKFDNTCVLEMDGIDGQVARNFYTAVWNKMEQQNIRYTLHWGKINFNLNENLIRNMYGNTAVDSWINARNQLMSIPSMQVFSNDFMHNCGLDKIHQSIT
ncbi:MAG: FAD-binding protein [Algibacter sp.]|uniref:FAD-binding protein n=1 Tax=Algibacter sp. TaxID=1872428 RepID=UPI003297E99F